MLNHHKHAPNIVPKIKEVDGLPHLCFTASEDISVGEQLEDDYGDSNNWHFAANVHITYELKIVKQLRLTADKGNRNLGLRLLTGSEVHCFQCCFISISVPTHVFTNPVRKNIKSNHLLE